ncbi:unnamed protein product, partial [Schistosoma spindalis]
MGETERYNPKCACRSVELIPKVFCPSIQSPGLRTNNMTIFSRYSFANCWVPNTGFVSNPEQLSAVAHCLCLFHLSWFRYPPLFTII